MSLYDQLLILADDAETLCQLAAIKVTFMRNRKAFDDAQLLYAQEHLRDLALKIINK